MTPSEPRDLFRVGQLAQRTGVSVRTLHHYDEMGLLCPTVRAESGHRLYTREDLARLQQILSLRQLGFSLDEIRDCLAQIRFDPVTVLQLHLARARDLLKSQHELCTRLEKLTAALEGAETVSTELFLSTLEATMTAEKHFNLPPDQSAALASHWAKFTPEEIEAVQNEWPVLIANLKSAMNANVDPSDPQVQAWAARSMELVAMFTGGNPSVSDQLRQRYETDASLQQQTGVDPAYMAYVDRALAARKS